jgi:Helix-turn-helix domain/HRDC domain/PIF1-like helicase/UvrD-like helicase C-terminal domain
MCLVRADVMDAIDTILKSVRRNYDSPFGGVQLLCIGDLHQLPPVAQNHEWSILQEYYGSPFFFDSLAIKEQQPLLIELNKIYRQKEQSFVDLLNAVRTNNMTADDYDELHSRYNPSFAAGYDENYITLTSHNRQADLINNNEIQKLLTPHKNYAANIENDFPESMYPADSSLMLKVGAQVMFLKNDAVEKKYFNGKIGIVSKLETDKVTVTCDNIDIEVSRDTWENKKYTLNRTDGKLLQETVGEFVQFPLRLAWAITIHKSQGLTFDKVMIDAGSAFSSGQVYVALSRCTSLSGIVLLSKIPATAIYSNENVVKGQQALTLKGSLAERFEGARQVYTQQILEELFYFEQIGTQLAALKTSIYFHKLKLNNGTIDWIDETEKLFLDEKTNGLKFNRHIVAMLKEQPVIENNVALQERLKAAANHFAPKLQALLQSIKQHPLVTEFKEIADPINEHLNNTAVAIHNTAYHIMFCKNTFTLLGYLQHKLNFSEQRFSLSAYASSKQNVSSSTTDSPNPELYNTLKRWRDLICEDEDIVLYLVATHAMLKDICTYLPKSKRELMLIKGFGKAKVEKYGDEILDAIIDYCDRNNISQATVMPQKAIKVATKPKADKPIKENTKDISYNLYKAGKTIDQIATERNFATQTIEGHLAAFVENGQEPITSFVDDKTYQIIESALLNKGEKTITDIKADLPEISFGQIRMVQAALRYKETL